MAPQHTVTALEDERRLSRAAVLAIAVAGFATFLDLYATQPLLPLFEQIFHATKAQAGLTVSASTAAVALAAPFIGALADRAHRKHIIVLAIFGLMLPTLFAATAHGLNELIVWRFLQGLAIPGVYVLAIAYITEESGPHSVGAAMAAFVTGNVIGGFSGRVITGLVAEHAGWRAAFVVLGILNLVGALATARWLPPSRHFTPHRGSRLIVRNRALALRDPRLVATYIIGFSVLFALVAAFTYVTFYLAAPPFRLGTAALSWIFSVYMVGAVITPIVGPWIDKLGPRLVLVSALVGGAGGMLLTLFPSLVAIICGLGLTCSAVFVCQAASTSYLRIAAPPDVRSLASGVYVTLYYVGGSVGGVLPALIWKGAGWPGAVALVVVAQVLTATVALFAWREGAFDRTALRAVG